MIPYLEIRDKYTLKSIAMVEPQECWLELSYQGVGEFEIYCRASQQNLLALQKGRYVSIPNKRFVWVITSIKYTFTAGGARMISATGYEAKWLLSKRVIQVPKMLQGTITSAIYGLVNQELGTGANAARTISDNKGNYKFFVDKNNLLIDISGTQAPRENLLEFLTPLLKNYNCGSIVTFENETLKFTVYTGNVKTNSIIFSQSLDNLLASEYFTDESDIATNALVVSSFDEKYTIGEQEYERKVDYLQIVDKGKTGIDRAEILIESNISTKYEDENGNEQETTPGSALYKGWQTAEGNAKLAEHLPIEETTGEIDLTSSLYEFDYDFFLGDMVRIQDEYFNFFVNTRITKYTFKQDADGYGEEAEYGGRE